MTKTFFASFDGKALIPDEPQDLPRNMRLEVRVSEAREAVPGETDADWLEIAASMRLQGPPNASERVHEILYGIEGR